MNIRRDLWLIVLVLAMLLNGYLTLQVKRLQHMIEAESSLVGRYFPPLTVVNDNGKLFTVDYANASLGTVIYVFHPDCVWCRRNEPAIAEIAQRGLGKWQVIGVSLASKDLRTHDDQADHTGFESFHSPPKWFTLGYKVMSTPQTLVLSRDGKVLHHWRGAYSQETLVDIERALGLTVGTAVTPSLCETCKIVQ